MVRILCLFSLSLIFLGISGAYARDAQPNSEWVFGAVYSLSGPQSKLDIPSSRGAQLAVRQANSQGGIQGHPVKLIIKDAASKPKVVAQHTRGLLNSYPRILALLGLSDTDLVLAGAPIAAQQKRLWLSSGATSPRLPTQIPIFLFLACFGDNVQAAAGAQWAYQKLGARSVVVVYNQTHTYTRLLQEYFQQSFRHWGGKIELVVPYRSPNLGAALRKIRSADLIFVAAENAEEAHQVIRQLRQNGIQVPVLGGDGYDAPPVWKKYPETKNVFFTTHAYLGPENQNPRVIAFRRAYAKVYDGEIPDAFAALGYDAMGLLLNALKNVSSVDPSQIRLALAKTRNYAGVTGKISYENGSRIPRKTVSILAVTAGRQGLVEQLLPDYVPNPD